MGDVSFHDPLIALWPVLRADIRKKPVKRRTPWIALDPRDLFYFLLVCEKFRMRVT